MSFDQEAFVKEIYNEYRDKISYEALESLLTVDLDYNVDNPFSTGKKLQIKNIAFKGVKTTDESFDYSNDPIDYSVELDSGINIWIADNLKGKSSIFKIVKYALTGKNSLKRNIKEWITEILLYFKIGDKDFSVYLNLEGRLKARFYHGKIASLEDVLSINKEPQFEASSEKEYTELIQDFFFKQFSYYSLKWTQKASQKDKNELLEAGASWVTYFKSILLESKDSSDLMYGSQGKKVFQMLLGLELTYPINRLQIKKDNLEFEKGKESSSSITHSDYLEDELQNELDEIERKIAEVGKTASSETSLKDLYEKYESLYTQIDSYNEEITELDESIFKLRNELNEIVELESNYKENNQSINSEINKTKKRIIDLNEYLEIGAFFNNLNIKRCPNCDHKVHEISEYNADEDLKCNLCKDPIDKETEEVDEEVFNSKISQLEDDLKQFESKKAEISKETSAVKKRKQSIEEQITTLKKQKPKEKDYQELKDSLKATEEKIKEIKANTKIEKQKNSLIEKRAILQYKIDQISNPTELGSDTYSIKISILESAITNLKQKRIDLGSKVLSRLKELILDEIHEFGLTSITEINITDNFEVKYKQDGNFVSFDEIAEGEQLRAKIAFYLSLIQLDIEYNFGRHTRFLIIDSPGKEEADSNYLEGFSKVLQSIDTRFHNELQILIGTAERELSGIINSENKYPEGEFIF